MRVQIGLAALVSLLAAGCQTAPPERQWTKPGATVDDVRRDLYWCSSIRRPTPNPNDTPATQREAVRSIDSECMEGRGYQRAPKS